MNPILAASFAAAVAAGTAQGPSLGQILDRSPAADWRAIDPARTLYLDLPAGRVIIELAPDFAPNHVANIATLAREHYFDGLAVVREHEDYVAHWADPDGKRAFGTAQKALKAEFDRPYTRTLPFTPLPDRDTYAPQAGLHRWLSGGARPGQPAHLARPLLRHGWERAGTWAPILGSGAELYAVIGQAPRQLDRNVTLVGRVLSGMERLSSLPRGTGELGFYKTAAERTPVLAIRLAADLPPAQRTPLEALRTDSATFAALTHNRRFRQDEWYKRPAGHIDVCNMPLPVRIGRPKA